MSLYVTKENNVVYKVLLYSKDADLIYNLEKICLKRNIVLELIQKNTSSNRIANNKYILYVIYDLREYKKDVSKILKLFEVNTKYRKLIVLNSKNTYVKSTDLIKNESTNYLILENIDQYARKEIIRLYFDNGDTKIPYLVNLRRSETKKNIKTNYNKIVLSFILFILILPYILVIGLFLDGLMFSKILNLHIPFSTVNYLNDKNYSYKKIALNLVNIYKNTPYINVFYTGVYDYASSSYELTRSYNYFGKEISEIGTHLKLVLSGRYEDTIVNVISNPIQNSNNAKSPLTKKQMLTLKKIDSIDTFFLDYLKNNNGKYILVVFQDDPHLYPTGRGVSKTILYKINNDVFEKVEELNGLELSNVFKGNINNISRLAGEYTNDQINPVFILPDKYEILKTIYKEGKNIKLSSILFLNNSAWKDLDNLNKYISHKNVSLNELLQSFDVVIKLLNSKNLVFIYEDNDGNKIESGDLFSDLGLGVASCMDNKIQIIEVGERNDKEISKYKLSGDIDENYFIFNIAIDSKVPGLKNIVIKRPTNFIDDLNAVNKSLNIIGKNVYETLNAGNIFKGEVVARYRLPLTNCRDGFAIDLEKQINNEAVEINYEVLSNGQMFMFLNNNLTGRGNKFYNTQSVKLSEDLIFKFIK